MSTYVYPTSTLAVSDTFQDHVARGSVNPGTDYMAPYGSNVVAVASGTVTDADSSNDGSGGRTIHVDNDDGTGADYLHLSVVRVSPGQWVPQGALLGSSGASGYGSDWYYGAHLHISFRPNHSHGYGNSGNQDFDAIMTAQGGQTTPGEGDDMSNIIHHPNGTLALAATDGSFTVLTDMDQVNSLVAAGVVPSDQNQWVWLQDGLIWQKLIEVAGNHSATNNPKPTPPPAEEEETSTGWSWSILVGVVLIVVALVLPIIQGLLPSSPVSQESLDTGVKVLFGAAAVLLGVGAGDKHWFKRKTGRHHPDEPAPLVFAPGTTPPRSGDV